MLKITLTFKMILPSLWNNDQPFSIISELRICHSDQLQWWSHHNVFLYSSCNLDSFHIISSCMQLLYLSFAFNSMARFVLCQVMCLYYFYDGNYKFLFNSVCWFNLQNSASTLIKIIDYTLIDCPMEVLDLQQNIFNTISDIVPSKSTTYDKER